MRNVLISIILVLLLTFSSACKRTDQSGTSPNNSNASNGSANPANPAAPSSPAGPQQDMNHTGAASPSDATTSGITPADSEGTSLSMLAMDFHGKLLQGDKAKLEPMLADDYKRTRIDGKVVNKAQELASLKKVDDMLSMEAQPAKVSGDTATVTGKVSLTSPNMSGQKKGSWQTTDTFKKRGGQWLVVSSVEKKD